MFVGYLGPIPIPIQGPMQEGRGNEVHDQRFPILQPGNSDERGGSWGHSEGEHKRSKHRMDKHEP